MSGFRSNDGGGRPRRSRRAFLGVIAAAGVGAAAYAVGVEPRWLCRTDRAIRWSAAKPPFLRIAHLSDFHLSGLTPPRLVDLAADIALESSPDLVALTGDFWSRRWDDAEGLVRALRRLSAAAPCFACPGNHDGGGWAASFGGYPDLERLQEILTAGGVRLLRNESATVTIRGGRLAVIGVGDIWAGECDPAAAWAGLPAADARLALSHNPDSKDRLADRPWDLLLCGHTHGGQLVVPGFGWRPFAPVRDRRYVADFYIWHGRPLFITTGVGSLHGARFNCRPEVAILDVGANPAARI